MSQESHLMEAAKRITGDDAIFDVAEFRPRGSAAAGAAGAMAGSMAGGDNTLASGAGLALGAYGAQGLQSYLSKLPRYMGVAVSPTDLYILGLPQGIWSTDKDNAYRIAKINRDDLGVEVHQRLSVRVVVLEDLSTGHRYELEAPRINFYHAKTLIELLKISDQHYDSDEEPETKAPETV